MADNNGKWKFAFWIITILFCTIFLGAMYFMGNHVIANEQRSISRDEKINDGSIKRDDEIKVVIQRIDKSLVRISAKLGVEVE